jgi:aryl-alcohol dehydrogenase-like predicted oxidoreductase/predicted kinase
VKVALGSMRLSTDPALRDEPRALATLRAALDAGVRTFDTARAYGLGDADLGHHERLLARAFADAPELADIRVVTKCGMTRPDGRWVPDGRARVIEAQARASAADLRPLALDTLLLHAPDPRVSLATGVRALDRLRAQGIARRIGLSNVTRRQLLEAADVARVDVLQIALGPSDDGAARGGVLTAARDLGVEVMAYAALGGPKRASKLSADLALAEIGRSHGATPVSVLLSYLGRVHHGLVPIVGVSREGTAAAAGALTDVTLTDDDLATLDARFPKLGAARRPPAPPPATSTREVVLVMGVPGAGKSTAARAWMRRGYERLNRDELGGTLRGIAKRLDAKLAEGVDKLVLDNTYLTRASRADVVRIAHAHGARVRCVHVEVSLADAQRNVVERMLERHGRLLAGADLARVAKADPNVFVPTVLQRAARDLEPPDDDEGLADIERTPFVRSDAADLATSVIVSADALWAPGWRPRPDTVRGAREAAPSGPWLVYAWRSDDGEAWSARAREESGALTDGDIHIDVYACVHAPGPPVCWCRPPLPGLAVAFARAHHVDLTRSVVIAPPHHRAFADGLGARFVASRARDAP